MMLICCIIFLGVSIPFCYSQTVEPTLLAAVLDSVPNKGLYVMPEKPLLELEEVEILENRNGDLGIDRLNTVEGTGLFASKKNEVILLSKVTANLSTNCPRQIYAKVPGLNIWESDGGGLQLGIGARGLSPNRTAHFNTRQNGYDISADPIGYPESYYTPPSESLEKIIVIRGAASLQYGPQFGGMINYIMKKGAQNSPFIFTTRQTGGLYGFYNTFNSIGGTFKKFSYYGFYQYKQGDGWRPNSDFSLHSGYSSLSYQIIENSKLTVDYTHTSYLAQQAGGLTDAEFERDPSLSKRDRNWFRIKWNLASATFEHSFPTGTKLSLLSYINISERSALGNLDRIIMEDLGGERTLIHDTYRNSGTELRLLHRYTLMGQLHAVAGGVRFYRGMTVKKQGFASSGNGPDFDFIQPQPDLSDFRFPGLNASAFAENIFQLTKKLSITPGIRWEYIQTRADGYYVLYVKDGADNVIVDSTLQETIDRRRSFVLVGAGMSYKPNERTELYGNFSQNYRAITFSDLRVVNPNFKINPNLTDERGYNIDIGIRGSIKKYLTYDGSLYFMKYKDRIGTVLRADEAPLYVPYRYRTNVADTRTIGIELYGEMDILEALMPGCISSLSFFVNGSLTHGRYINSREPGVEGKQIELVSPIVLRTGVQYGYKSFAAVLQYSYTHRHYSDATNAEWSSTAVAGIIPSYYVLDLSARYGIKWFQIEAGINNLTNNIYFTRRAESYPGPGIIPAEAISFYLTLQYNFVSKPKLR